MRILIVEDERPIAEFVQRGLEAEGYSVSCAYDGQDGLAKARSGDYALVVLDVLLPKLSGLEVIRGIREQDESLPVIMLTALAETDDVVTGLDLGANDYLTKPFAFAELVARVQALGRRSAPAVPPVLEQDGVLLDPARRFASRDGRPLDLTPKEFAVLEVLLRSAGRAVSTEDLLEQAWDAHTDPFTNAVRVTMMTLRRKLGDPPLIATVPRVGYRLGG